LFYYLFKQFTIEIVRLKPIILVVSIQKSKNSLIDLMMKVSQGKILLLPVLVLPEITLVHAG